jgi:hypothetical protein
MQDDAYAEQDDTSIQRHRRARSSSFWSRARMTREYPREVKHSVGCGDHVASSGGALKRANDGGDDDDAVSWEGKDVLSRDPREQDERGEHAPA